ncbi:MAG: sulfatase [Isosphaeraceae bacterium]|nr:sulfatase [Isosphaeraceae bacterium]
MHLRLVRKLAVLLGLAAAALGPLRGAAADEPPAQADRPNILWIIGEDMGPELGCYGYPLVRTPNLDRLASQGARFTRAFTTAPVCSPSRSALITGMYQTTIGAHNHRGHRNDGYKLPDGVEPITAYFRRAGYFTANVTTPAPGLKVPGKTDFNFNAGKVFDGTDWSQRRPGQPFYAQVNFTEPHRGPAWPSARRQLKELVDPAKVELPPYYPDDPIVRDDWANYLDAINLLDEKVGKVLKRLEDEGLTENTVVFFLGDNGQCHVRGKQFLYDGGIHIPLLVRWPGRIPPGTVRDDLISAIDISATSLKLAGIDPPKHMQGRVFLGPNADPPRTMIFAARDRCDETVDRIRCVRTARYKYIRNFYPDRPYTQPNKYKETQYPALAVMKRLYAEGKLTPEQALFMQPRRPAEELYDLESDPHEVHNLAGSAEHAAVLAKLRKALDDWMVETNDQGAIPEDPAAIPMP